MQIFIIRIFLAIVLALPFWAKAAKAPEAAPVGAANCLSVISNAPTPAEGLEAYDARIGKVWATIFRFHTVPADGVVIEVAPGSRIKVGLGLAGIDFRGSLYIVEPNAVALREVVEKYRSLLPQARVIGIQRTLETASLPARVDALVANHPIDDMILSGLNLTPEQMNEVFDNSDSPQAFEASRRIWSQAPPHALKAAQDQVFSTWESVIARVNPGLTVIAQYESGYFKRHSFEIPDQKAREVLARMKLRWGRASARLEAKMTASGQDPQRWLISQHRPALSVRQPPSAFHRLPREIFVPQMLMADPLSENDLLFADSSFVPGLSQEAWVDLLKNELAVQILPPGESSDERADLVGYADRQRDPLTFAMDGNEGSGRAVYLGNIINIKGLGPTSLATSKDNGHNSGFQPLRLSAQELIGSNVTYTNLRTGSSPVMGMTLKRDRRGKLIRPLSAKIYRKDENGSLDRPTHIFEAGHPQSRAKLLHLAENLGAQDAEKFIERISHGAYSMGNTALSGQMLDFETAHATRGRSPIYSVSSRWPGNYFGLEHLGQMDLLRAFVGHELNVDHVSADELHGAFYQTRRRQLIDRFPDLMGASPLRDQYQWQNKAEAVENLVRSFEKLSQMMFADLHGTHFSYSFAGSVMVFDFSRFMRWVPLYLRAGKTSMKELEALLFMPIGKVGPLTATGNFPERVVSVLEELTITSNSKLAQVQTEARKFIRAYVRLFREMSASDRAGFEARALMVNEDRIYMGAEGNQIVEGQVRALENGSITNARFNEVLEGLIQASNRVPLEEDLKVNVKVNAEGISYILVRGQQHCQVMKNWGQAPVKSACQDNIQLLNTLNLTR